MTSIRVNRQHWNLISRAYQEDHDPQIGAAARLWGMFAIPDARLNALGEVTGKRVLELGCGAGQWSRSLAAEGAAVVGLDLSEAQLAAAATAMGAARYPLVQAAAQQLPFAAASFDVVFCDHGGLSWAPASCAAAAASFLGSSRPVGRGHPLPSPQAVQFPSPITWERVTDHRFDTSFKALRTVLREEALVTNRSSCGFSFDIPTAIVVTRGLHDVSRLPSLAQLGPSPPLVEPYANHATATLARCARA